MERILITGGAGFIGCHVTRELLKRGYHIRLLDSLIGQVHGEQPSTSFGPDVEFVHGDVRDASAAARALDDVDAVIHLAAEVGVGQSMYEIERYTAVNDVGTAVLFEQLMKRPVRRVVTASSMSIYGEGLYRSRNGETVEQVLRVLPGHAGGIWDPVDANGAPLSPAPTPEWKRPSLSSVYALNKYVQERLTLMLTAAYGMEGVCLRLFNVYGPGQALSNPYTGVLAIFASRLLNGQPPLVFEDGQQRRDFVHVGDVARAFALALEEPGAIGGTFNVGSGQDRSVLEVAGALARAMGCPQIAPELAGKARIGDIRHCFCDTTLAEQVLGFRAEADFEDKLAELASWVSRQIAQDRVEQARAELEARGLVA